MHMNLVCLIDVYKNLEILFQILKYDLGKKFRSDIHIGNKN